MSVRRLPAQKPVEAPAQGYAPIPNMGFQQQAAPMYAVARGNRGGFMTPTQNFSPKTDSIEKMQHELNQLQIENTSLRSALETMRKQQDQQNMANQEIIKSMKMTHSKQFEDVTRELNAWRSILTNRLTLNPEEMRLLQGMNSMQMGHPADYMKGAYMEPRGEF